ncbi:hypothetical protein QR685DRAFT_575271 [Neurospora intermedia]|uniref:Uncharacterized protein n=1 Tax=Neurospora intermedia TaxID=5142 RepID=A0ABR3D1U6_NEUIN
MARILLASCIVVIALLSRTFLFYLPSFYLYTTTQCWPRNYQDPKRPTEPACQRDGLTRRSDTKTTAKPRCNTDRPSTSHSPTSEHPPHDNGDHVHNQHCSTIPSAVRSLALASPLPGAIVTSHRLHWLQMLLFGYKNLLHPTSHCSPIYLPGPLRNSRHTHYTRSLHAVYKVEQGTSRNRRSSRLIQIKLPSSISWLWPSTPLTPISKKALISAAQHPGSPIPSYNRDYSLSLLRLLLLVAALLLYAVTIIAAAPAVADCCCRRCVVTTAPVKLSDAVSLARSFEAR